MAVSLPGLRPRDERGPAGAAPETPRPPGPLVWFHTGSGGAVPSVLELAARLRAQDPDLGFLLTTTATEPGDAADAPVPVAIRAAPPDRTGPVRSFLRHWRPNVAVWTECDLWPVLIGEARGAGVPLYMLDARTARPDPRVWRWRPRTARRMLISFNRILAGDRSSAFDLRKMGAEPGCVRVTGYLEEGTPALGCDQTELDDLSEKLAARPVWLAAGVTGDEELDAALTAQRRGLQRAHRLLLILVPDEAAEGPAIAQRLIEEGWSVALRSAGEEPARDTQIYIADTDGEMGLWYRLAPICFLGRSLTSGPGRNPFEAAALGSAIMHGPNVRRYRAAYTRLAGANAARLVRNAGELGAALEELLAPDVTAAMAQEAWRVCTAGSEVTDAAIEMILDAIDLRAAG